MLFQDFKIEQIEGMLLCSYAIIPSPLRSGLELKANSTWGPKSHSCQQVRTWRQTPNVEPQETSKIRSRLFYAKKSWDLCCELGLIFDLTQLST
jgi:hypothetical protein